MALIKKIKKKLNQEHLSSYFMSINFIRQRVYLYCLHKNTMARTRAAKYFNIFLRYCWLPVYFIEISLKPLSKNTKNLYRTYHRKISSRLILIWVRKLGNLQCLILRPALQILLPNLMLTQIQWCLTFHKNNIWKGTPVLCRLSKHQCL